MNAKKSIAYREVAQKALKNATLQKNLRNLYTNKARKVLEYYASMPHTSLRDEVRKSRRATLENLDVVLSILTENVEKSGGHVFCAETADDAVNYCLRVAGKHAVRRVVKSKSMLSAEINIDQAFHNNQIDMVETDLGEFIVQLAGDKPSHIITPSIHLNRAEVGQLFQEKLGIQYSDDPATLTMAAREALRKKFLEADMGLTGCNFGIAKTGKVSLVSNEGNIRMATTLPPVHVALMGIERVVANMYDLERIVQLLTRAASARKSSTYLSFSGTSCGKNDSDGPREFHLVIIDNGRSKILHDQDFREVLSCIRCGACLNICPVYGKIGGHAYHSPYSGPIGAVISPLLLGINRYADLCKGESLCGACKEICPVKIDIPLMLLRLREMLAYGNSRWGVEKAKPSEALLFLLWSRFIQHPFLFGRAISVGRLLQKRFPRKENVLERMVGARAWTATRDLPTLANVPFRRRWKMGKEGLESVLNEDT